MAGAGGGGTWLLLLLLLIASKGHDLLLELADNAGQVDVAAEAIVGGASVLSHRVDLLLLATAQMHAAALHDLEQVRLLQEAHHPVRIRHLTHHASSSSSSSSRCRLLLLLARLDGGGGG